MFREIGKSNPLRHANLLVFHLFSSTEVVVEETTIL